MEYRKLLEIFRLLTAFDHPALQTIRIAKTVLVNATLTEKDIIKTAE